MTGHLFTQIPDPMVRPVDHADVGSGMNKRLGGDKDLRVIDMALRLPVGLTCTPSNSS